MKFSPRYIVMGIALSLLAGAAWALDLPVKRINGKDYYYYAVQRGESLMDVAKKIGVSRDDILRNNPGAADGVRRGMNIYLPVAEFTSEQSNSDASAQGGNLRYKVEKGETLYGIAYKFDVSPDDIIALNPTADRGIKAGQTLIIPVSGEHVEAPTVKYEPEEVVETVNESEPVREIKEISLDEIENRLKPVNPPRRLVFNEDTTAQEAPDSVATEAVEAEESTIAVLLPLSLKSAEPDKQAKAASDFARGFMLGLKSMKADATPTNIKIYDTYGSNVEVAEILGRPELSEVNLIIAPEQNGGLKATADIVGTADCFVMNLFSPQDTTYLSNPNVIQTYIPAALMYEKAAEALMQIFDDYTPVFLISKGGRSEKLPFTNHLREQLTNRSIEFKELPFDGILTTEEINAALDYDGKYVFIPASGSLTEFNKFANAVIEHRQGVVDPSNIAVFGYPDWTAFLNDSEEKLHQLGATIYSRFFSAENTPASRIFTADYFDQYGSKPLELLPSQAMLGYDTARYLLTNLKNNNGVYSPEDQSYFEGIQSTFMFVKADEELQGDNQRTTGPVNQALYIIRYLPGTEVQAQVL